jgi:hypothetical protein
MAVPPRHPMYASRKSHSVTLVDNRMESGNAFHVISFPQNVLAHLHLRASAIIQLSTTRTKSPAMRWTTAG